MRVERVRASPVARKIVRSVRTRCLPCGRGGQGSRALSVSLRERARALSLFLSFPDSVSLCLCLCFGLYFFLPLSLFLGSGGQQDGQERENKVPAGKEGR